MRKRILSAVLAAVVAVSVFSGIRIIKNGNSTSLIEAGAVTSLPNIESIKSRMNDGAVFNILEVTPKATDDHPDMGGSFGYLVSGSEPIDIISRIKTVGASADKTGNELRSEYANNFFIGLEKAQIAGNGNDVPITLYPTAGRAGEKYYHELWPWEADVDGQNTYLLDSDDSIFLKDVKYTESDDGSFSPVGASYVSDADGDYIQNITSDNPYETLESAFTDQDDYDANKDKYVFYKMKIVKKSTDELSSIPAGTIIFSREKETDPWDYDYLATERSLYSSDMEYAVADGYAADPVIGTSMNMTLDELNKDRSVSENDENDAFWCVSLMLENRPFVKADDGKGYFSFSASTFRYVGNGNGQYNLTVNDSDIVTDHTQAETTILYNRIRYTGGYKNNDWFLKNVMDFTDDEISDENGKVHVDYVSPDKVTEQAGTDNGQQLSIGDYDMIVLSNGFDPLADNEPYYGGEDTYINDKVSDALRTGLTEALKANKPVLCDSSAVDGNAFGGENNNPLFNPGDNDKYSRIDRELVNDNNNIYGAVQTSVYVFRRNTEHGYYTMASKAFEDEFKPVTQYSVTKAPFYDVYDDIRYENELRTKSGETDLLPQRVGEAQAVRYIINYAGRRVRNRKSRLRVLDIEPENTKLLSDDADNFKNNTILKILPGYNASDVTVTTISTRTLAGLTDDLTENYDVIYIGDRDRKTDFIDSHMNGLAYYNIGDTFQVKNTSYIKMNGYLDSDYSDAKGINDTYRTSGNDISVKKANELNSFILQGYPVILSDDLATTGREGTINLSVRAIDYNTRFYEILSKYPRKSNVMTYKSALSNSEEVVKAATVSAPVIDISESPKLYDANNPAGSIIGGYDGNKKIQSEKKLDFRFQIINETELTPDETSYTARIYADLNSDGVFKDEEEITETEVSMNGSRIPSDALTGNINKSLAPVITISAQLPESLQGAFAWKLEVTRNPKAGEDASAMTRSSRKGVSFVGLNDKTKPIDIRVLQINKGWNGNNYNLEYYMNNNTTNFGKYLNETNNNGYYKIQITTVDANNAEDYMKNNRTDWRDYYDMLLLGFGDNYGQGGPSRYVMNQVGKFIDDGKSVLFCHDNINICSLNKNNDNGKKLIKYKQDSGTWADQGSIPDFIYTLRAKAHMDVYGISDSTNEYGGQKNWSDDNYTIHGGILAKGRRLTTNEQKELKGLGYSVAYKPISGYRHHQTIPQVQGFATAAVYRYNHRSNGLVYPSDNMDSLRTHNVEQVNKGQITSFPYEINKGEYTKSDNFNYNGENATMNVSETHGQWYQLNTNDNDIVVWYTVEDGNKKNFYGHNDCVNDYYIYNCGNITYTGAGHANNGSDVTADEAKLFVNTMIASFRTSKTPSTAAFVSDASGKSETSRYSINAYSDSDSKSQDNDRPEDTLTEALNNTRIYFKITDTNMAKKTIGAQFSGEARRTTDANGNDQYSVDDGDILNNIRIYDAANYAKNGTDRDVTDLKSKEVYYIKIPGGSNDTNSIYYRLLNDPDHKTSIYMRPTLKIGSADSAPIYGSWIKLDISLSVSNLFNLG